MIGNHDLACWRGNNELACLLRACTAQTPIQVIQRCAITTISVRYGRVPRACVGYCLAQAQYIHCAELSCQTVNATRVSAHIQPYYPFFGGPTCQELQTRPQCFRLSTQQFWLADTGAQGGAIWVLEPHIVQHSYQMQAFNPGSLPYQRIHSISMLYVWDSLSGVLRALAAGVIGVPHVPCATCVRGVILQQLLDGHQGTWSCCWHYAVKPFTVIDHFQQGIVVII